MPTAKEQLQKYLKERREEDAAASQLSVQYRYAQGQMKRAAMPVAEKNDVDAGDGARRKIPIRYEE